MIALDTTILVSAHRAEHEWFEAASGVIRDLAESPVSWAIPWHCLVEFVAVTTHPRIFRPPTPQDLALGQVDNWLESPTLQVLTEERGAWGTLRDLLLASEVIGPRVHDARVAAVCRTNGVSELWTAEGDVRRFPGLRTRNPLSR